MGNTFNIHSAVCQLHLKTESRKQKKKIIRIEVKMKDMGLDKITQKEKIKLEKMD